MTPEVMTSLVNLGSAGAVIIVVMIFIGFLRDIGKQAAEERVASQAAINRLANCIGEMQVFAVKHHDFVVDRLDKIEDGLQHQWRNGDDDRRGGLR